MGEQRRWRSPPGILLCVGVAALAPVARAADDSGGGKLDPDAALTIAQNDFLRHWHGRHRHCGGRQFGRRWRRR